MSDALENQLLIFGLVCLGAAIVGGGLKALGIEVPLLKSIRRQLLLALFGLVLLLPSAWEGIMDIMFPPVIETRSFTIDPGHARNLTVDMSRKGRLSVVMKSVVQDLNGFSGNPSVNGADSIFVRICGHQEVGDCPSSQMGEGAAFGRDLQKGQATVQMFSYGTSPKIIYSLEIKHP
ncbi:hypothetical protein AB7M29_004357 [Pseudomonas sp. F-14 TE3623]